MTIDLDQLLQEADEYAKSVQPIDVPILLGTRKLTARISYIADGDSARDALAAHQYPNPYYRDPSGSWFNIPNAARVYPGVVLIDGDDEDDLFVLRDQQAVYRWHEVYDALMDEDRLKIQSAIWGLYVGEVREHRAAIDAQQAQGGADE